MEKQEIRKKVLQMRKELSEDYRIWADDKIYKRLTSLESYQQAKLLFSYVSYKSEADTKKILQKALNEGKTVAVPKVMDGNGIMEFYEIQSLQELKKGYQGIEEPDIENKKPVIPEKMQEAALMIMPGAAFDGKCNRIGYGGGFYDRYLNKHSKIIKTIAICYEKQLVNNIPAEELDVKPDMIITEQRMISALGGIV